MKFGTHLWKREKKGKEQEVTELADLPSTAMEMDIPVLPKSKSITAQVSIVDAHVIVGESTRRPSAQAEVQNKAAAKLITCNSALDEAFSNYMCTCMSGRSAEKTIATVNAPSDAQKVPSVSMKQGLVRNLRKICNEMADNAKEIEACSKGRNALREFRSRRKEQMRLEELRKEEMELESAEGSKRSSWKANLFNLLWTPNFLRGCFSCGSQCSRSGFRP